MHDKYIECLKEVLTMEKESSLKAKALYDDYEIKIKEIKAEREEKLGNMTRFLETKISDFIKENVKFNKNDKLYYPCDKGSGYYLKFNRIESENIILDIYTKGWKFKENEFILPLRCFASLEII